MDKFCRGCLVRYEEPTELFQYTEKNRRLFVYSTGLQVKRNDIFTFQLCKDCYVNMKLACNFKKQCRNSDRKFKSYLALKEADESVDLPTYLKNNDDSWMFRFPPIFGSSTPAYQRPRDDDNESTSTSIRNFITDIMPEAELPDTEARIVREVIEEHDDVLDDSLDSHWLQDDASVDNDFKLDFSFSPFSTPRSANNDRYTPKKLAENALTDKTINHNQNVDTAKKILDMPLISNEYNHTLAAIKNEIDYEQEIDHLDTFDQMLKNETAMLNDAANMPAPRCTIDKNLEAALTDTNNTVFALDDLLVSPKGEVIPEVQSPSTTLINKLLFGEKLDIDENSNDSHKFKAGRTIENFQNVQGDIDMDYIKKIEDDMDDYDIIIKEENFGLDDSESDVIDTPEELKGDEVKKPEVTSFYCKMCERTFKSLRGLKRHSTWHSENRPRKEKGNKLITCDRCGMQLKNRTNLLQHIKIHERDPSPKPICDLCKTEFPSKGTLIKHLKSHTGEKHDQEKPTMRYMCPECGLSTNKASNMTVHRRRHQRKYAVYCKYCEKGFYRKAELTIHMRYHTGEKPYICAHCNKGFVRRDALSRHVKCHLDLKPFKCQYCHSRFVNSTNLKHHFKTSRTCVKIRDKIFGDHMKLETSAYYVEEQILIQVD